VIVVDGDLIRFSHPLLASALYADAPEDERRRVHGRLADVVTDPEERARHLALAADGPDLGVASELDSAARLAMARGATDAAAALAALGLRLTPPAAVEHVWRRTMDTAEYRFRAGEGDEARVMLERLAAEMPPGPARAEVLWHLGRIRREGLDYSADCLELFRRALAECAEGGRLRALVLNAMAWLEYHTDLESAARHAKESAEAARGAGDLGVLADSLASVAFFECLRGSGEEEAAFEAAIALEPHVEGLYVDERPTWVQVVSTMYHDGFDEARRAIRGLIDEAVRRGEDNALPTLRFHLALLESWAGRWDAAREQAEQGYEDALQTDQPVATARLLAVTALTDALQGRLAEAREKAEESLRRMTELGQPALVRADARAVIAFVELSGGNAAATVAELAPLREELRTAGIREPGAFRIEADLAEALVLCGDTAAAGRVVADLEEQGARLGRASALATGARCRGMLHAAEGDLDGAIASLERSLREHERYPAPFERGRSLLALGQVQRRSKRKRQARDSLNEAMEIFEGLGAPVWAERTRAELARIGGRARGTTGLTPTEQRVADLAADGKTNREIADGLFLSVKTVEANLSRVYRKLGVRSRTELARTLRAP